MPPVVGCGGGAKEELEGYVIGAGIGNVLVTGVEMM
jgi:hypothetical protein